MCFSTRVATRARSRMPAHTRLTAAACRKPSSACSTCTTWTRWRMLMPTTTMAAGLRMAMGDAWVCGACVTERRWWEGRSDARERNGVRGLCM